MNSNVTTDAPPRSPGPAISGRVGRWLARHRWVSTTTVWAGGFLLITMGGAIVAAPLTVPLLTLSARVRSGFVRWAALVIAALTVGEVVWAATYVLVGEAKPWIWLAPLVALLAFAWTLTRWSAHGPPMDAG